MMSSAKMISILCDLVERKVWKMLNKDIIISRSEEPKKSYRNPGCATANGSDRRILFSYLCMN